MKPTTNEPVTTTGRNVEVTVERRAGRFGTEIFTATLVLEGNERVVLDAADLPTLHFQIESMVPAILDARRILAKWHREHPEPLSP